jgi:hypothetical protein
MKSLLTKVLSATLLSIILISCGKVMITGRKQVLLFSQGAITSLSNQAYSELKTKAQLSDNEHYNKMVK